MKTIKATLPSGDEVEVEIVVSRLKAQGLVKGEHLILHFVPDKKASDVSNEEAAAAFAVARKTAREKCHKPGRARITLNDFGLCTRDDFHLHIVLPSENDKLPPVVDRGGS